MNFDLLLINSKYLHNYSISMDSLFPPQTIQQSCILYIWDWVFADNWIQIYYLGIIPCTPWHYVVAWIRVINQARLDELYMRCMDIYISPSNNEMLMQACRFIEAEWVSYMSSLTPPGVIVNWWFQPQKQLAKQMKWLLITSVVTYNCKRDSENCQQQLNCVRYV